MSGFPVLSHFTSLSPKSYIIISGIFRYFHLILKLLWEFSFLHLFILLFLCYDRTDCYESNLFITLERGISMNFITKSWKGILLCLVIAVPCWFLGQTFPIIGGPVFGILAGMIITLLLKDKSMFQDGITFVSKKVLQYAVILLGFGLNLSVILETGKQSLPIIVTTISTSLIIAYLLHKVMHVPGNISTLVGVGSAEALQLPQQHRSLMRMMKKLHRQSLLSSFSTCSPHCSSRHLVHCLDSQPKAEKPSVSLPELRSTIPLP